MNTSDTGAQMAGARSRPADNREAAVTLTVALLARLPLPPCPDEAVDLALCLYRRFADGLNGEPDQPRASTSGGEARLSR